MRAIRVAVYRVGREMAVEEIPAGLESYQGLVGGLIEEARLVPGELALVCNEEGIILGLPPNRTYRFFNGGMGLAFGDFFVCRVDGAEYAGLTGADLRRLPALIDGIAESIEKVLKIGRF